MFTFLLPINKPDFRDLSIQKKVNFEDMLVQGLRESNAKSINQLYKMYAPALFGIIKRIVKCDEIAEDILQDTFVKIWKSIRLYDSSKGRLFTWLANLAKNLAIDQIRSKSAIKASKTDDIFMVAASLIDSQSHAYYLNTDKIGYKNLLIALKPDQKRIIDMIYFQGYTHVQTSEILNLPLGTVKTKLRLAILFLRKRHTCS